MGLSLQASARVYCRSGQEEKRGAQNTTRYSGRLPACAMADKAAIYYPGLTGLAQRPRGGKPPNWNFVAPAKGGGGVLKTPTPLASCLLACIATCYLPVCIIIINLGPINNK